MKGINKNESAPVAWPSTEPSINKYPRAERHKEQPEPALTNMWPSQQQTPKLGSTPKKYEERDSFEETYLPQISKFSKKPNNFELIPTDDEIDWLKIEPPKTIHNFDEEPVGKSKVIKFDDMPITGTKKEILNFDDMPISNNKGVYNFDDEPISISKAVLNFDDEPVGKKTVKPK